MRVETYGRNQQFDNFNQIFMIPPDRISMGLHLIYWVLVSWWVCQSQAVQISYDPFILIKYILQTFSATFTRIWMIPCKNHKYQDCSKKNVCFKSDPFSLSYGSLKKIYIMASMNLSSIFLRFQIDQITVSRLNLGLFITFTDMLSYFSRIPLYAM